MKVYGLVGDKRGKSGSVELILRALNGRISQSLLNILTTGKESGIAGGDEPWAAFLFRESLRIFVNAWIDSAKTKDGEQPWERTFSPELFLQDYVERNPPMLVFAAEGPGLTMFPRNFGERKRHSEFTRTIEAALLSQLENTQSSQAEFLRKILPFVFDVATALFLQLLDSPKKTRLFRCDECGVYFLRTRTPKKDMPIYRGSWCAGCKGKGSARRANKSRENRTGEMIKAAADAWSQWKPDRRHGKREEWVARRVNKQQRWKNIKRNWVTGHTKEIEAELEQRRVNG